jgi:urocanate hydratase
MQVPEEVKQIYRRYAAIAHGLDAEYGLGGRLLYAGPFNEASALLLRAANIAGAASLTTAADGAALREAMRGGVVDFVVTTLDEALRILKNEIRKKQPVAVGIHGEPAAVEREMQERGVKADLSALEDVPDLPGIGWIALSLPVGNATLAAELDAVVMDALPAGDQLNRRWYRASPRYLGREFRSVRTLACDSSAAGRIRAWAQTALQL